MVINDNLYLFVKCSSELNGLTKIISTIQDAVKRIFRFIAIKIYTSGMVIYSMKKLAKPTTAIIRLYMIRCLSHHIILAGIPELFLWMIFI